MPSGDEIAIGIVGVVTRRYLLGTTLYRLSPKQRTDVLELCLARTMEWWIANYAPLRFNPGYARRELGYEIKGSTWRIKQEAAKKYADAILPNVRSGETRRDFLASLGVVTKAVGGAKSGQVTGKISWRLPGYITASMSLTGNVLAKIPRSEGERICDHFAQEVTDISSRFQSFAATRNGVHETRSTVGAYDATQLGRTNRATITAQRQSMAGV